MNVAAIEAKCPSHCPLTMASDGSTGGDYIHREPAGNRSQLPHRVDRLEQ
jgi:hypothetical protein